MVFIKDLMNKFVDDKKYLKTIDDWYILYDI